MAKVFLKDVVQRIKDNVDKDNTQLEYYIGGEHFDSGEIRITEKGVIKGSTIGPAFHMRFQPRDVLLMSRNPHLKKAGVVDFEGICSDVSYVCRTKNEQILIQDFLPFIFQTNSFWDFAEANKKGSTNFFLNWSDFEKYEFELPSIEKQKMLADLLWSIIDVKYSYKKLYTKSNELIQSRFIEMFGDISTNTKGWNQVPLGELCDISRGGSPRPINNFLGGTVPWIKIGDATDGDNIYLTKTKEHIIEDGVKKSHLVKKGSLIFANCGVSLGFARIITFDGCIHDGWLAFENISASIDKRFVLLTLNMLTKYFRNIAPDGTQPNLNTSIMKKHKQIVPPLTLQKEFVQFVIQVDKSKLAVQQSLKELEILKKSLMQQYFG